MFIQGNCFERTQWNRMVKYMVFHAETTKEYRKLLPVVHFFLSSITLLKLKILYRQLWRKRDVWLTLCDFFLSLWKFKSHSAHFLMSKLYFFQLYCQLTSNVEENSGQPRLIRRYTKEKKTELEWKILDATIILRFFSSILYSWS